MRGRQEQREVDPAAFRAVLGGFATGVGVMTTLVDGHPHGMTANALTSVSLDPPLVLVCVDRGAVMAERVVEAGAFALSFLARDQRGLSTWFADEARIEGDAEFDGVSWRSEATGSPVLDDVVGWVDCRVWSVEDGGDHLIVIGRVEALGTAEREPLLYFRGAYGGLAP